VASCFVKPDEFIPERWFSKPELVLDKTAFIPWSLGPTSCAGKQLALMEMRSVITHLVTKFRIDFAPGNDGSSVVEGITDHFAQTPGDLMVVFTEV
jgi:cytochrome P450